MLPSEYIKRNKLAILSPNCLHLIDKLHEDERVNLIDYCAYILATVRHETAHTYAPIAEYEHGTGKAYSELDPITGQRYYGRGYVQLTWKSNYEKFGKLLDIDLVNNPDLSMQPNIAYEIMVIGMIQGLFTGKKLSDYINAQNIDYVNARRIINGIDQAQLIAGYAQDFEDLLNKVYPNIQL